MKASRLLLFRIVLLGISTFHVFALDNGLALVPPMGWNSWNLYACEIDEALIRRIADRVIALGLDALGYVYMNLDDCWMATERTSTGAYQANATRFPSGMKALGDHLHSKHLKYGIYTSAGTKTCQGYPGSLGYEQIDAETFAEWGVDYLKYDNCYNEGLPSVDRYTAMRDALLATNRPIFYSLCNWGEQDSWRWASSVGNSWRTTGDIGKSWESIANIFWKNYQAVPYGGKGSFADPDMLEVGVANLSLAEQQSHFALWVMVKAPLLLAMDLDTISDETLGVIRNRELIRFHQDAGTSAALCFLGCEAKQSPWSIFATAESNGDTIAWIINWSSSLWSGETFAGQDIGVVPNDNEKVTVTNLWTNKTVGTFNFDDLKTVRVNDLEPHGCAVFRFTTIHCLLEDDACSTGSRKAGSVAL